jgi:hypothetical protein
MEKNKPSKKEEKKNSFKVVINLKTSNKMSNLEVEQRIINLIKDSF